MASDKKNHSVLKCSSSLKLDRVGCGQRNFVDDRTRQSVRSKLVFVAVISRHSIHWHDHIKAAQSRVDSREKKAIMRRRADWNDRFDSLIRQ
jgi:hypothetical protein